MLQTAWESDQIETVASEKSWNLQGWLSVGSHKLVQQTLRALVRRCSHPYAVRGMTHETVSVREVCHPWAGADCVRTRTLNVQYIRSSETGIGMGAINVE